MQVGLRSQASRLVSCVVPHEGRQLFPHPSFLMQLHPHPALDGLLVLSFGGSIGLLKEKQMSEACPSSCVTGSIFHLQKNHLGYNP